MFSYPMTYPMMPQQPQPQQNGGVLWVQGEAAAKSYQLAPNTTLALWDSERTTIYLKSTDAAGMPTMKILDYTIRESAPTVPPVATETWATKEEINQLANQIKALEEKMKGAEA